MSVKPAYRATDVRMLVSVCRNELRTSHAPAVDYLYTDCDQWQRVVAAALDHGLIGPLYKSVLGSKGVPEEIFDSLELAYLQQSARNVQLTTALVEILALFAKHGVDAIVWKGPAVALIAYDGITWREFTDLDLLVRPKDLKRARLLLADLEFRQIGTGRMNPRRDKDIQFINDAGKVLVELHWAFNPTDRRFPVESTGIWDRLQTVYFQRCPIHTLSIEDTLLVLSIHASVHRWACLKWVFDIARILALRADTLNWSALVQRCAVTGCTRTLLLTLHVVSALFGAQLPNETVMQIDQSVVVKRLGDRIINAVLTGEPLGEADLIACHVQIHDHVRDRFFVAASLSTPQLPRLLPECVSQVTSGPLRFVTRPLRLAHLYGLQWLRVVLTR